MYITLKGIKVGNLIFSTMSKGGGPPKVVEKCAPLGKGGFEAWNLDSTVFIIRPSKFVKIENICL